MGKEIKASHYDYTMKATDISKNWLVANRRILYGLYALQLYIGLLYYLKFKDFLEFLGGVVA